MRQFVVVIGIILSASAAAQSLSGRVFDRKTKAPIANCLVLLKGKLNNTVTDQRGKFNLMLPEKEQDIKLVFTVLGYSNAEFNLSSYTSDTFYLSQKSIELKEIVISANKKMIVNKKSDDFVLDFDLLNGNVLLLMAGPQHNILKLVDENGENMSRLPVNKNAERLDYDCLGNLQLYSADSSWQIYYDFEKLNALHPFSSVASNDVLSGCVCSDGLNYYFQKCTYKNLRTEYFYYNVFDRGKRHSLVQFEDSQKVKIFQHDFDLDYFLKARRGSGYTLYAEPIAQMKEHLEQYREQVPLTWQYSKLLGKVETQMLRVDTTVYLFNFTDSLTYKVENNGKVEPFSKLILLRTNNIHKKVFADGDYKHTYMATFDNSKLALLKFDVRNGKELTKTEIDNVPFFPKKILVQNGSVYFLQKNLAEQQVYKLVRYELE
ncbi:MAG: carboxypeptidase-like regulatory domain-containing protein [bacterium]|nr:carboxypeptidase-like regulatory domain-containing protein [bacterium]